MRRNDVKYLERRAAQQTYDYMERAEDLARDLARIYQKASVWITEQSNRIFEKYRSKYGLTEKKARALLTKIITQPDIDRLINVMEAHAKGDAAYAEALKELDSAAYASRIRRFRDLQNELDITMTQIFDQEKTKTRAFYTDIAQEQYYRSIFDVQQRAGVGFSFARISEDDIDRILHIKWAGGNYSSRAWGNTQKLAKILREELLVSFITGRTEREVARIISDSFNSGAMKARRLVRTESNFVSSEATALAYQEAQIEKYRYVATLDLRTSRICRELDGQEFPVSARKVGTNCPPMHPWCRSTTIAAPTEEELKSMQRRGREPVSGKSILVPASMTYRDWYKIYVEPNPEALQLEGQIWKK
jgi:SPP1 gp7 family putative phage head morphogenesis protein